MPKENMQNNKGREADLSESTQVKVVRIETKLDIILDKLDKLNGRSRETERDFGVCRETHGKEVTAHEMRLNDLEKRQVQPWKLIGVMLTAMALMIGLATFVITNAG
ncbi:MAG: hypothetical protein PVJ60_10395 [Phycisphaerales bacterium]|jgi:hypothetical protein